MKRALIKDLHAVARQRGDGYLEACLKAGKISQDGQWMIFDDAAHTKLRLQYNPNRPPEPKLGNLRAALASAAKTALATAGALIKGEAILRTEQEAAAVEAICRACPHFRHSDTRCSKCRCTGGGKLLNMWKLKTKRCPLPEPKW
jgi:hypothetical protein